MDVTPFRGYRYDPKVVDNPGLAIAPPYDVIDLDQRQRLQNRSPYNIVRVIKAEPDPADNNPEAIYDRAAQSLNEFVTSGALKQDPQPSIYVYVQHFQCLEKPYRRSGFIALGGLADYGGPVKPHEQTLAGPKADRLNLMRATRSQIGQIFMLYNDPTNSIDAILAQAAETQPLLTHTDDDDVEHQLFALTDPGQIATVVQTMSDKDVFIADGHHRYETALNYYRETKDPAAGKRMMTFVNTHNEGLLVLPTHRLVNNVANFDAAALLARMGEHFDIARLAYEDVVEKTQKRQMMQDSLQAEFNMNAHAFGMYFNDGAFHVATLRDTQTMDAAAPDHSEGYRRLDVAVLHKLILEDHLGIDEVSLTNESHVEYIKDFGNATAEAIDRVDEGKAQALFFLNPTRISDINAVVAAGEKMPQKSTFFFPKMFSGLVINVLENR